MTASDEVHLSELVACLALATDLGMGQPLDHGLRTCLLAVGVGERLGLSRGELADAYYISLLRFVGCNAHAHQDSVEVGDEIAFRAGVAPLLSGETPETLRFAIGQIGRGSPKATRVKMIAGALAAGSKGSRQTIATTCEVAQMIATSLDLGEGVVGGLAYTFERHDGKGLPQGAAGEEIPVASHVAMIARDFEVLHRVGGRELVTDVMPRRRGRAYDPKVLDGFLEHAWGLLDGRESQPNWGAVIAADPLPRVLVGPRLEDALRCLGVFSDMKSTYTHGYSQAVADLARRAGAGALNDEEIGALGAAALVQELGMTGVSNALLEKEGALAESEWERVRLQPYLTDRILARCAGLSAVRSLAAAHHERMDGGGYHRGMTGPQLTPAARLLAAAGAYVAMTSKRSWRPALPRREAVAALRELAAAAGLEVEAVDGVLAAAGEPVTPRR
ncbi:MAG: HD domain-containing phosphohydrolase, partial [Actinomycetota bacterium]